MSLSSILPAPTNQIWDREDEKNAMMSGTVENRGIFLMPQKKKRQIIFQKYYR